MDLLPWEAVTEFSSAAIQNVLLQQRWQGKCGKLPFPLAHFFSGFVSANGKSMPALSRGVWIQILLSREFLLFLPFLTRSYLEKIEGK